MALTEPSCPARPRRKQKELEEQERERKREEKLRRREQKQRDRELRRSQKKLEKLQAEEQRKLQERIRLEERKLLLAQRNLQSLRLVAELLSRAKVPPPGTPRPREAPPTGTARPGRPTLGRLRPQGVQPLQTLPPRPPRAGDLLMVESRLRGAADTCGGGRSPPTGTEPGARPHYLQLPQSGLSSGRCFLLTDSFFMFL